jgi:hypothetical protein
LKKRVLNPRFFGREYEGEFSKAVIHTAVKSGGIVEGKYYRRGGYKIL